jgi:hypothetical protein
MLPSISPSQVSSTSGASGAADSVLSGAASALIVPANRGAPIHATLAAVDRLAGAAAKAGVVPGTSATKVAKPKATGAGYAQSTSKAKAPSKASTSKSTAKTKSGPLAFLDDPKLSIEDKLMRLLAYLNDKWDKEIDKKLKELKGAAGGETATSSSAAPKKSSAKKSSGILGSLGSIAKSFFPGVGVALDVLQSPAARAVLSKVGGPVLAAAASAVGFPELAPLALRYGPGLVDLAAGVATSLGHEATAAASGGAPAAATSPSASSSARAASGGSSDGDGLSSDRKAQLKLMEIQRVIDQQREMFSLVSNMLRSGHDTRMAVIQNVR